LKQQLIWLNGKLVPSDKARISILDSAYLYGEGLFETLLAKGGRVLFMEEHFNRLYRSAPSLRISIPLSRRGLEREIYRTLKANRLGASPGEDAYIRLEVSNREDQIGNRKARPRGANLMIYVRPFTPLPKRVYRQGAHLILVRATPNDLPPLAGIKSINYLSKMVARREVKRRGADEGVLLNNAGRITECSSSNFFLVKNGVLLTPPLKEGLLPGITRLVVLKMARRLGIPVQEKSLTFQEARRADEIFITSTLKGIAPVSRFESLRKRVPGPVTTQLGRAYRNGVTTSCGSSS